jgi:hypothetical protein
MVSSTGLIPKVPRQEHREEGCHGSKHGTAHHAPRDDSRARAAIASGRFRHGGRRCPNGSATAGRNRCGPQTSRQSRETRPGRRHAARGRVDAFREEGGIIRGCAKVGREAVFKPPRHAKRNKLATANVVSTVVSGAWGRAENPPITDHSSRRDAPAYRGKGPPCYRRPGRVIVAACRLPVARVPPAAAKCVDVRVKLACLAARAQDRRDAVEEATELRRLGRVCP